jgi:hypothetical protein
MAGKWHGLQSVSQSVSHKQPDTETHFLQTLLYWLQPCIKSTLPADLQCISPAASEHVAVNSSDVQRSGRFLQQCSMETTATGRGFTNRLVGKHNNMGSGFNEQCYWDTTRESGFMNNATETGQFPFWFMITVIGSNQSRLVFYG